MEWWQQLLIAAVGTGVITHLIDRFLYRGKPKLDIAAQVQEITNLVLQNARSEMQNAWDAAKRAEIQADDARKRADIADKNVAELNIKVAELTASIEAYSRNEARLQLQLSHYEDLLLKKEKEVERLTIALGRALLADENAMTDET